MMSGKKGDQLDGVFKGVRVPLDCAVVTKQVSLAHGSNVGSGHISFAVRRESDDDYQR